MWNIQSRGIGLSKDEKQQKLFIRNSEEKAGVLLPMYKFLAMTGVLRLLLVAFKTL